MHQNDYCIKMGSDESHFNVSLIARSIKMGSDESHFNVSLIVRNKATSQYPQTTTFWKRTESGIGIEPRPFCLPA